MNFFKRIENQDDEADEIWEEIDGDEERDDNDDPEKLKDTLLSSEELEAQLRVEGNNERKRWEIAGNNLGLRNHGTSRATYYNNLKRDALTANAASNTKTLFKYFKKVSDVIDNEDDDGNDTDQEVEVQLQTGFKKIKVDATFTVGGSLAVLSDMELLSEILRQTQNISIGK